MSDFKKYYNFKFYKDLNQFFSTIPDESKFHEDMKNKETFSIQFERLTPEFKHLSFLDKNEKRNVCNCSISDSSYRYGLLYLLQDILQ